MSLYIGGKRVRQVFVMKNDGTAASCIPANIRKDVLIYGVKGAFTETGTQSAGQAVATSNDIVNGCSAWVDGTEVQGSLIINNFYTGTEAPAASMGSNGDIYLRK